MWALDCPGALLPRMANIYNNMLVVASIDPNNGSRVLFHFTLSLSGWLVIVSLKETE